jgi:hypothetical protein
MAQSKMVNNECLYNIHGVDEIVKDLQECIMDKKPFSILRFGDGGLKLIWSIMMKDKPLLNSICKKEGIPISQTEVVLKYWTKYANEANYIDCPQVYMTGTFWPRVKGENKVISVETKYKLEKWVDLYKYANFTNTNYCNPEINYLLIVKQYRKPNLLTLMKDRKICMITAVPRAVAELRKAGYNIDIIRIVRQYEDQYTVSFQQTIHLIKKFATKYDFFLVAAGELGRIYTGLIKECGGRAVDIGFVAEFWGGRDLHTRLRPFLTRDSRLDFELKLRAKATRFVSFL